MRTDLSIALAGAAALAAVTVATPAAHAQSEPIMVTVQAAGSQHLRIGHRIQRVSIAGSDIADVAAFPPDQLLITGKRPGATTATVWTQTDEVLVLMIDVTYPVDAMRTALRRAIPGADKLDVQSAGATIVLSGRVPSVEDVARAEEIVRAFAAGVAGEVSLVNGLTVPGNQQVQLEVAFAEVSRTALREIGFNFWSKDVLSSGNGYAGGVTAPGSSLSGLSPELGTTPAVSGLNHGDSAVPLVNAPLQGAFGFIFSSTLGGFPFSAALSLLSSKGFSRTLAEPTLVAMSGKSATFLAGGQFPIPVPQAFAALAIEYRKFGVQLAFTPTVIGQDIQLDLAVTVSDIDFAAGLRLENATVPGLTERHSETTIRLKDGQSFVIAGLLSDRVRSNVSKVPGLGDLPILGTLFRSSSYRREETELLVVVTAHLVQPMEERPPLPGEKQTTDPSDLELFLLGTHESLETEGTRPPPRERPRRKRAPAGAVGFQR
jgi:pilus assembly protein CpaC